MRGVDLRSGRPLAAARWPGEPTGAPQPTAGARVAGADTDPGPGTGAGSSFGTFGELIQGALPPYGRDFLVTFPVARWSHARFRPEPGAALRVEPADRTKSATLAARMLASHGLPPGGLLTLRGTLPVGKGMASSSADLVASARAIADAYHLVCEPVEIEDLIRDIEPSDGVMYDGAVAFCHREVRLLAAFGPLPRLTVIGVDEGGVIDTVAFNKVPKAYTLDDMYEYEIMLADAYDAVKSGDAAALGELATRSARMNQRLVPKRLLDPALDLSRRFGALGVVAAHSGTALGVLLSDDDPAYDAKLKSLFAACSALGAAVQIDHSLP